MKQLRANKSKPGRRIQETVHSGGLEKAEIGGWGGGWGLCLVGPNYPSHERDALSLSASARRFFDSTLAGFEACPPPARAPRRVVFSDPPLARQSGHRPCTGHPARVLGVPARAASQAMARDQSPLYVTMCNAPPHIFQDSCGSDHKMDGSMTTHGCKRASMESDQEINISSDLCGASTCAHLSVHRNHHHDFVLRLEEGIK